jgi:hypothetical protein
MDRRPLVTSAEIGLGNTGSAGVVLASVRPECIVTALVVWSQIVGYLLGPPIAGGVTQALGFSALGLVPAAAAMALVAAMRAGSFSRLG